MRRRICNALPGASHTLAVLVQAQKYVVFVELGQFGFGAEHCQSGPYLTTLPRCADAPQVIKNMARGGVTTSRSIEPFAFRGDFTPIHVMPPIACQFQENSVEKIDQEKPLIYRTGKRRAALAFFFCGKVAVEVTVMD